MIAAGLDGINHHIDPLPSVDKNIYEMTPKERRKAKIETLPDDLPTAMKELEIDRVLTETLGSHIMENLQRITELEWEAYRTMVHSWEQTQYLNKY